MIIKREFFGKEVNIKLSDHELYLAFEEQQHTFDKMDIEDYFSGYSEQDFKYEYGCTRKDVMAKVDDLAYEMRRNIERYDMEWVYARDAAIAELGGRISLNT